MGRAGPFVSPPRRIAQDPSQITSASDVVEVIGGSGGT